MICKSCNSSSAISSENEIDLPLCEKCNFLLDNMALRPDMWFRIARILGPNEAMIHDDFYEENGFPIQSDIEFDEDEYRKYVICRGGPYKSETEFIDDILTQYVFGAEDIQIPSYLNKNELERLVLKEIELSNVEEILYSLYEILSCLPSSGLCQNFLRNNCQLHIHNCWGAMTRCLIKQLPIEESKSIISNTLLNTELKLSPSVIEAYESEFAIDLLVNIIANKELPVSQDLGLAVRVCNPSWEKIKTMINNGRPESLLAIDALWLEDCSIYSRYFQKKKLNKIHVDTKELDELLSSYLEQDSVPRVRSAIDSVREKYGIQKNA